MGSIEGGRINERFITPGPTFRVPHHYMGARLARDMKPEIILSGELKRQDIVVVSRAPDEHNGAVWRHKPSRYGLPLPHARIGIRGATRRSRTINCHCYL